MDWQPYDWRISYFIDVKAQSLKIRVLRKKGTPFTVLIFRNGHQLESLMTVSIMCRCDVSILSEITKEYKKKCEEIDK